jgi:branched-subunit amino acid aminotransferase/4-amino-4-deoxychorismate lyase
VIDQHRHNSNAVAKAEPKAVTKAVIIEKDAKLDQLLTADAVFLTNSLMGIQQVSQIDGQTIEQNKAIETLSTEFNRQFIQD